MFNRNDPELLSAYLDDALSPEERAALEARLQADADLRREMARLRATVELIGTLPTLRAPRDLTLTPRMVRRPSLLTSAAFSAMSAAAAVVLLVIGAALFSLRPPAATPLQDQVAFAPTTLPMTAELRDTTSSAIPQAANSADATALKSETEPGSDGLFLRLPTGTPAETALPPMLYAARATEEAFGSLEMQADSAVAQETEDDQPRDMLEQPAPLAASGAAAAAAPLPQPTLLPSATPTETPSQTPTLLPSATPQPTFTPSQPPAPTPVPPLSSTQNTNTFGIGLIVAALLLFGVALVTTLLRRRA